MQLYEQILKEFDDKYRQNTAFSTVIPAGGVRCGDIEELKSFLKQSFIKFLESECERLKSNRKQKLCDQCYEDSQIVEGWNNDVYHEDEGSDYNQALSDTILHYQNMIKELHDK